MFVKTISKSLPILLVLLLSGCSVITELRLDLADKLFGREAPNQPAPLKEIKQTQASAVNWSHRLANTDRYDFTPVIEAGAIFAADASGDITKISLENGREVWTANVDEVISGGVGVGGGLVLVGTKKGKVFAYDVDGKQVWQSQLSSEVLSAPRYADGLVIARSGDNHIYGLDAADGTRKWVYSRKVPALSLRSSAGIVVDGGAVYAGFSGGKMAAIRADNGRLLWEVTVAVPKGATEIERIADITSLPVIAGPVVYAVAFQGRVAAIDRVKGKVLWNRQISSYSGMNFKNEQLYVSHALGSVYSLDYATGRTFWRQGDLLNRRLTTPSLLNDVVAVGDLEGYVHFLDMDTGKIVSRIRVDDHAVMATIPTDNASQLIVATRDGGLYSVGIESGPISNTTQEETPEPIEVDETPDVELSQEDIPVGVELNAPTTEIDPPLVDDGISTDVVDEESAEEASESILFKKNAPLISDDADEGGPGIVLPKSE